MLQRQTDAASLHGLRQAYGESLGGRLEPYIEENISSGGTWHAILRDGDTAGYCCLSVKGTLLQFCVADAHLGAASEAFAAAIEQLQVRRALVYTRDRLALSLCLDRQAHVEVSDFVFDDGPLPPVILPEFRETAFRSATRADVPLIRATVGDFHDFLHYTLEGSIDLGEIFMLLAGEVLLGTGVIAGANARPPYVDIGMCVNEAHRQRNVGTQLVMLLREHCHRQGWLPGASCKFANVASRRTLEKAGMVSRDRILRFTF